MVNKKTLKNFVLCILAVTLVLGAAVSVNAQNEGYIFEINCPDCQKTIYSAPGTEHHNEAQSGIVYQNGKFALDGVKKYNLPSDLVGADKKPYKLEFTFSLDSIIDPSELYNNGNGRNIIQSQGSLNSVIRAFPVEDDNGNFSNDVIAIGTLTKINIQSEEFIKVKAGERVNIALFVDPSKGVVDIYFNGVYAITREGNTDAVRPSATQWSFGFNPNNAFSATISDISIISLTGVEKWADGVKKLATEISTYQCSCGKTVHIGNNYVSNANSLGYVNKKAQYTIICKACGLTVGSVAGIEHHVEATSGITYTEGGFKISHDKRPNYVIPSNLVGTDNENYKIEFELTFDKSASLGAMEGVYNSGNGRNLMRYDGTFNSILRSYPVSDGNGGFLPDTVELKTKGNNKDATSLLIMKVGDRAKFSFLVSTVDNTTDIFVNGIYVCTRKGDNPVPSNAEKICFGDSASPMHFTLSGISITTPDKENFGKAELADGVEFVGEGETAFKCSCGELVAIDGGTSTDQKGDDYMSQNGIDRILGLRSLEFKTLMATEDTYVSAGTNANNNYSNESKLLVKHSGSETPNNFDRVALIKFDISSIADFNVQKAWLEINCISMQDPTIPVTVHIYGCNPSDWKEDNVTYYNAPEKEDLEATIVVSAKGKIKLDITDYIKLCRRFGDKEVAFYFEGESSSAYAVEFSTNADLEKGPKLILSDDTFAFATKLDYNDEDPWELAMRNVSTWLNRWKEILARGDSDTYYVQRDESEYSIMVGTSPSLGKFDGAATKFTDVPMRNISTLKGYSASREENAKLDIYGGLMDESMKQEATGYFYTKKIGDRWWTIDPLGYPFFRTAVTTVKIGNDANRRAREIATYGSPLGWTEAITEKLKGLGFNSVGGFSGFDENLHTQLEEPLSQTHIMYVMKRYAGQTKVDVTSGGNTALLNDVMPVFDPAFVPSADESVRIAVTEHATNSFVYGWMSDNELPRSLQMLDSYLSLDHTDERFVHSYATAWTFMFMKTGKVDVSFEDVTDELRKEFRAMVYDKYFEVTCGVLERYAPYQQYMGCRFYAGSLEDEYIMRVAGHWCDVITYNYYIKGTPDFELLGNQIKWAGKPVVITEWYVKGLDAWEKDPRMEMVSGAGAMVKTQEDRGKYYQNYALALIESKNCVGFDWFWLQDPNPDDTADGSNSGNKGILDGYGNEYTDMTKYAKELNTQKYNLIEFFDERNG